MSYGVTSPTIPRGSRFWGLVRWTFGVAFVVAVVIGASRRDEMTFAFLGGLAGVTLLELRFLREGRHPFLCWSDKRVNAAYRLTVVAYLVALIGLIAYFAD